MYAAAYNELKMRKTTPLRYMNTLNLECIICYNESMAHVILPCAHNFCATCAKLMGVNCPVCNKEYDRGQVYRLECTFKKVEPDPVDVESMIRFLWLHGVLGLLVLFVFGKMDDVVSQRIILLFYYHGGCDLSDTVFNVLNLIHHLWITVRYTGIVWGI